MEHGERREDPEEYRQEDLQLLLSILRRHGDLDLEEAVEHLLAMRGPDYRALVVDPPEEEKTGLSTREKLLAMGFRIIETSGEGYALPWPGLVPKAPPESKGEA